MPKPSKKQTLLNLKERKIREFYCEVAFIR